MEKKINNLLPLKKRMCYDVLTRNKVVLITSYDEKVMERFNAKFSNVSDLEIIALSDAISKEKKDYIKFQNNINKGMKSLLALN